MMGLKAYVRQGLLAVGRRAPDWLLRKLGNIVSELELDSWLKAHGLVVRRFVSRREALFELVASEVGQLPVRYLEFGVASGEATRVWSRLLKHPEAVLHGFDSFEGLPENWTEKNPKGMYGTGGVPPIIDDSRIRFFKGWFENTLSTYQAPKSDVVILNMDADLYSSTIFVLRSLRHLVRPGTYLYFDEFACYGHEERAFREFVEQTGFTFRLRGATPGLTNVLFQCVQA